MSTPAPSEAAPDTEGDGLLVAPEIPFLAERIEHVPIDALVPHPANPNVGDVGQIGESIDAVGFYSTVFVQRSSGLILAGEHRWRALRERGAPTAPVVYLDVDDETALRILIADNELPRRTSHTDDQRLAALLVDLATQSSRGLTGLGWDTSDLDRLLADLNTDVHDSQAYQEPAERLAGWEASAIRQIVLVMSAAEFDRALDLFARARETEGLESNTDVMLTLLGRWDADHPAP